MLEERFPSAVVDARPEPAAPEISDRSAPTALPAPMPRATALLLATGLIGYLLVNLSGQFVGFNLAEVQRGVGASGGQAAWFTTVYTMALLCGIVAAIPSIAILGLKRTMTASALVFALTGLACAAAPAVPLIIALRALQGFAAGGFGPMAFVTIFMTCGGPRRPWGLSLLALTLLLPGNIAPALSGIIEANFGWRALFVSQAAVGAAVAAAATGFVPRAPVAYPALRRDWLGLALLALALASSILLLGQGLRHGWLDSPLIGFTLALAVAAWTGFIATLRRSTQPVLDTGLLARPDFIGAIAFNFLSRIGVASIALLSLRYLNLGGTYSPLETGQFFAWVAVAQIIAFPLVWRLTHLLGRRLLMGAGLGLCAASALLVVAASGAAPTETVRAALLLAGVGQLLFLVPGLITGAGKLTPADGPTATLVFNGTSAGGVAIGVALANELVGQTGLATRVPPEVLAQSVTTGLVTVGALLVTSILGLLLMPRLPPLREGR